MGLWPVKDTAREAPHPPAGPRKVATGARTGEGQARGTGEEVDNRHQEIGQGWSSWCGKDKGQGSRADEEAYSKVLLNADATAGRVFTNTDRPLE